MVTAIDIDATPSRVVVHVEAAGLFLAYEFGRAHDTARAYLIAARSGSQRVPHRDGCSSARRAAQVTMDLIQARDDARFPHTAALRKARRA